jgi:hypothetical protein
MQEQDDDQCIRCVAMQAAHDAGGIPLVMGYVLHGLICIVDAGVEENVQVDSCTGDDPEEVPAQGAETGERVVGPAETQVENVFGTRKQYAQYALEEGHQSGLTASVAIRALQT